ncbi:MAG: serine/threonine protein kinase [Gemmatimonadetes bacterium]|nr:serine/threonine protein kinase [Gemmatimonadota bacterium]
MTARELRPGTLLATRYEIVERLGSGGFGSTFRARDRSRFDADCVVKELLSARQENDTARRLFEREARVLLELRHPQIPTLHAYFEEGGRFYLVQDFVDGETLDARLRRDTRLPESEVRHIVGSLLDVLEYLHARTPPVIHRDIKPANVMLGADGRVFLIDFGAVREAIGGGDEQGTAIGTAGYTPREQAVGRPRPSSDLYALGATALEAVTGLHPLEWHSARTGKLDWKGRVSCSDEFEAFLDGMLAEVQDRFDSADHARAALRGTTTPAAAVPETREAVPDGQPSGRRTLYMVGVAAALVASILAWARPWAGGGKDSSVEVRPPSAAIATPPGHDTTPPATGPGTAPVEAPVVRAPAPRPDAARPAAPPPVAAPAERVLVAPPRTDSTRAAPTPSQELRDACARLLERISLGERLSDAETDKLKKECRSATP